MFLVGVTIMPTWDVTRFTQRPMVALFLWAIHTVEQSNVHTEKHVVRGGAVHYFQQRPLLRTHANTIDGNISRAARWHCEPRASHSGRLRNATAVRNCLVGDTHTHTNCMARTINMAIIRAPRNKTADDNTNATNTDNANHKTHSNDNEMAMPWALRMQLIKLIRIRLGLVIIRIRIVTIHAYDHEYSYTYSHDYYG